MNLDLDGVQVGDKSVPRPHISYFSFELESDDIEIDVKHSIVAWAVDLFIWFFKDLILPFVVDSIQNNVPKVFNGAMDELAQETGGIFHTGVLNLALDYSYSSPFEVSPQHVQVFFNGTVFNDEHAELVPTLGAAKMQVDDNTKDAIQAGLSEQELDSGANWLHEKGLIKFTLSNDLIPKSLLDLSTDSLDLIFPGLIKRYGKGQDVTILIATYEPPQTSIHKDSMGAIANFDVSLFCKGEEALVGRVVQGKTQASVTFKDFQITIQLTDFEVGAIKQLRSKIGDQDLASYVTWINYSSFVVLPFINALIPDIPFPDEFLGIKIKQAEFQARENYVYLTFSPIYVGESQLGQWIRESVVERTVKYSYAIAESSLEQELLE